MLLIVGLKCSSIEHLKNIIGSLKKAARRPRRDAGRTMRAVVQRVKSARCTVNGAVTGEIGTSGCSCSSAWASRTPARRRQMRREAGRTPYFRGRRRQNVPLGRRRRRRAAGDFNFTLYGSVRHGRRPEFLTAARPEKAKPYYEALVKELEKTLPVACGVFGADMQIDACNDGPVTLFFDTAQL